MKLASKLQKILLTVFLGTVSDIAISEVTKQIPDDTPTCYSDESVKKISDLVIAYRLCQVELSEKNYLITQKLVTPENSQGIKFWQEPMFVWGGLVVSASVASIATFYLVREN